MQTKAMELKLMGPLLQVKMCESCHHISLNIELLSDEN